MRNALTSARAVVQPPKPLLPTPVRHAMSLIAPWDQQPKFTMSIDDACRIAAAIENARQDLAGLFLPLDPKDVVAFLTKWANRHNLALPTAQDVVADALAVASKLPADLFPLACQRLWTDHAFRRRTLEPTDFTKSVNDRLDSRQDAKAKIERMEMSLAHQRRLNTPERKGWKNVSTDLSP